MDSIKEKSISPVLLTIGIPTYKREESLRELLRQIAATVVSITCEILVVNNGPDIDLEDELKLLHLSGYKTRLIQNCENCGGQENVVRIYENAFGKYVWFLGDDDRLFRDSLLKVFKFLSDCDCDLILLDANAKDHPKTIDLIAGNHGIDKILSGCIPLRKLMFAPLNIIKKGAVIKSLPKVRLYLGCFCPQLLLITFGDVRSCYYMKEVIISCEEIRSVKINDRLSMVPVFIGIGFLPNSGHSPEIRMRLGRLLKNETRFYLNPLRIMAAIMINRLSGSCPQLNDLISAAFRNYNILIASAFAFGLCLIFVLPVSFLRTILETFYKRVLRKSTNLDRYYSADRV